MLGIKVTGSERSYTVELNFMIIYRMKYIWPILVSHIYLNIDLFSVDGLNELQNVEIINV